MGGGGKMSETTTKRDVFKHALVEKPPFEISDLKKAIPPHCFKPSLQTSIYFLYCDICVIYSLYHISNNYLLLIPQPLSYIAWPLYWIAQGSFMVGVWNIVHDCSHTGFSEYTLVNDTIGFIIHSLYLTPYFSFKYSHRSHHSNTSSLEKDETWVPKLKNDTPFAEMISSPVGSVGLALFRVLLGYPGYFIFNLSGREYKGFPSHFNPIGPMFNDSERAQVIFSDVGVAAALYGFYRIGEKSGFQWLFLVYGCPWLVMSVAFMLFTYLSHVHPSVAHYDSTEWDWLRGALATVDRDYGIWNHITHHATEGHVAHHLFSTIPHYHLLEATQAIKPILGDYYNYDDTHVLQALFRDTKACLFVKEDAHKKGVYWYTNN